MDAAVNNEEVPKKKRNMDPLANNLKNRDNYRQMILLNLILHVIIYNASGHTKLKMKQRKSSFVTKELQMI